MNGAEVLTKFTADTSEMDKATNKVTDELTSSQKAWIKGFQTVTLAVDACVAALVAGGIEYNAQMQTYSTRLTTLTGSAEAADKVLQQIKKDAMATPFDVASLTQAESLLLSTGISADEARKNILALGDAVSASGGGNQELQRMAVNLQQIKNVGKASSLDIKQFAYAGIDIYGLLADSLGVTREEASKLDVTYEMLTKALQDASAEGGKYYGAMQAQSLTYNGAMSNLTESIDQMKGALSEGLFNALSGLIPHLTNFFNWITQNKDAIIAIGVPLLTFINILAGLFIIDKIALGFTKLWGVIMANPIGLIVAAITALVAAFIYLWNNCEAFREFWIGLWDGIKNAFNFVVNGIKNGLQILANFFSSVFGGIKSVAQGAWNFIGNGFKLAGDGIKSVFGGVKTALGNAFGSIGGLVKSPVNGVTKGVNGVIKTLNKMKVPDWVPGIGGKGINIPLIPQLATGTNYVPKDMLAQIHQGEAIIPKKFNPYVNPIRRNTVGSMLASSPGSNITIQNSMEFDALGQLVNNVKTFSGGAKNDYNYVGGY